MSIADNPILAIVIGVIFVVLFLWANRCSNCGKFFSCELRSRSKNSEGYRSSWKYDEDSKRSKHVREYTYSYSETYVCNKCGHSYSSTTSSSYSKPCGYFLSSAERKAQAEAEPPKPRGWYNPLRWLALLSFKRVFVAAVVFFIIFTAGFIIHDPEVLQYPTHFQPYLEDYVESLLDTFSSSKTIKRRTQVEVISGYWQAKRYVNEYQKIENEGWSEYMPAGATVIEKSTRMKPVKTYSYSISNIGKEEPAEWAKYTYDRWINVETLTATGTELPVVYPDNPCKTVLTAEATGEAVGEIAYGTRQADRTSVAFFVTLREIATGLTVTTSEAKYMRVTDRDFNLVSEMREADYRYLMAQRGKPLTARLVKYSFSSDTDFWIYVEEYPQ
jgi:transcription elongation factor Elf1